MNSNLPPQIFSPDRRIAMRKRMLKLQTWPDSPRYIINDMVDDILERLSFTRVTPHKALIVGDFTGNLAQKMRHTGVEVVCREPADGFDETQPIASGPFDFIASVGTLDTVNDLPGALIHIRNALLPGGFFIATFVGAGSLPSLRRIMLSADDDRPAPRIHPQIDARAGAELLQRTGFAKPVSDFHSLNIHFGTLDRLVEDLRAQGLSNILANPGPPMGKAALIRANAAFKQDAHAGRVKETIEIVTLTGWR